MADATFDGGNLHIQLPSIGTFDAQKELYSAWKEWIRLSDNAKYPPAFDTTGGDDVGSGQEIAPYFFCRNDLGWRIKMPQADGDIIISGNLFARSPTTALFEQTSGYDAFLRLEVSTRAVVINTGGGLTESDVRSQVDAALTAYNGATKTDTSNIETKVDTIDTNVDNVKGLVDFLYKYERGRWKIDRLTNKLTIYEPDGTTPLYQFDLTDNNGDPNSDAVYERTPV